MMLALLLLLPLIELPLLLSRLLLQFLKHVACVGPTTLFPSLAEGLFRLSSLPLHVLSDLLGIDVALKAIFVGLSVLRPLSVAPS